MTAVRGDYVMITRIKSDHIILENGILSGYVYFQDDKIIEVSNQELAYDKEYDMTGKYVSPGFIDIHTHGGAGNDFIKTEEEIVRGCNFHLKHGTTSICPTLSAAPFPIMSEAVSSVHAAMQNQNLKSNIIGAHLEGPYLSAEQCGAQCPDFITEPIKGEYETLIQTYGDAIARWSYAPENDVDGTFCEYLKANQIIPSAGHTDATYEQMIPAMEKGCNLITHLYSCTSTITRDHGFRHLGVIETAMLHDDMYVEIIADGKHLPPELIRLILKIKGSDKVALVTDSLALAGTDVTHGFMVDTEFIIEDGVCKLMDRSAFAGSIATADKLVRVMIEEVGLPVYESVKMMTKVPAEIMKLNKGTLEKGRDADIIVFNEKIQVCKAFVMGKERPI